MATYIDYLNDFNRWLESGNLPGSSQLMYFKLLNVFNRAGWPEYVRVDNLRMMLMIGVESKQAVVRARDKLVEAGFIEFQKGKKGSPNRYYLVKRSHFVTENVTVSVPESVPVSVPENVPHNKRLRLLLLSRLTARRKQSRLLSMGLFRIGLLVGSPIKSKSVCQAARRIQKRPCKAGRRTLTNVTGWTSTTGKVSTKSCSFRSPIHSGNATFCREANLGSSLLNSWRRWEAKRDAGHFFS